MPETKQILSKEDEIRSDCDEAIDIIDDCLQPIKKRDSKFKEHLRDLVMSLRDRAIDTQQQSAGLRWCEGWVTTLQVLSNMMKKAKLDEGVKKCEELIEKLGTLAPEGFPKWVNASRGTYPLEKHLHIKDNVGIDRLGNFFEGENGQHRLYINSNGSHEPFYVDQENFHYYSWLNDSESASPEAVDDKEAIEFADWVDETYARVHSNELGKSAWVDAKENRVLVHGSDYHYTKLINEVGKTTAELYQLFLKSKQ